MWRDAEKEKPACQQRVLIAYTDHHGKPRVTVGWYAPRWTLESGMFEGEVDDEYSEERDEFYMKEGWVDESWESECHYPISGVTHWQPLPKHPEALVSNLVNGDVPAGQSCFASHRCTLKHYACNGHGCPVADGRRVAHPFSCANARAYAEFGC